MNKTRTSFILVGLMVATIGIFLAKSTAQAGPVSGSSVKSNATVYDGVISVAPGGAGADILELGAYGTDIASSGDLYLRPNSLSEATGVRFTKNGSGTVDLHALGGVCLSAQCLDAWPAGGGTSLWNLQAGQYVEPATLSQGLTFTKPRSSGGPALEVFSANPSSAVNINNSNTFASATAITSGGSGYVQGNLNVTTAGGNEVMLQGNFCQGGPYDGSPCAQQINCTGAFQCAPYSFCQGGPNNGQVCTAQAQCTGAFPCSQSDYKVWYPGNDGKGSGLDASKLDGNALEFRYNISNSACNSGSLNCLCSYLPLGNGQAYECLQLQ